MGLSNNIADGLHERNSAKGKTPPKKSYNVASGYGPYLHAHRNPYYEFRVFPVSATITSVRVLRVTDEITSVRQWAVVTPAMQVPSQGCLTCW